MCFNLKYKKNKFKLVINSCGNNPSGDVELTMLLATIDTSKHKSINLFIRLVHFKIKFEFIILKFKNRFHKFLKKYKSKLVNILIN